MGCSSLGAILPWQHLLFGRFCGIIVGEVWGIGGIGIFTGTKHTVRKLVS